MAVLLSARSRRLLIALVCGAILFAAGIGVLAVSSLEVRLPIAFALIGAGVFLPFQQARLGAYLGFFGILAVAVAVTIYRFGFVEIWKTPGLMVISGLCLLVMLLGAFKMAEVAWRRA